ncbi:MAG: hypothetical protein VX000_00735, partial [Myxococcota bacterium]|nr:hypothetical protein [Myxococcota bacterium]
LADETWICTATPDDGDDDGAVGVDSVTVQPDTCAFTFASTASELSINPTGFGIGRSDFTLEMWIHAGTTTGAGTATVFRTNATPLNDPATVMHALVDTTDSTEVPYRAFLSLRDNWCEEPNEGYQAWIPRDGDWHHVATVRSGDRLLTFLDGVQTTNHSLAFSGTTPPLSNDGVAYMGALGMNPAPAGLSIGPMRFVSSAVYTSTFTPATDWTVDSDTIGQWNTTSCFDGSTLPDETGDNDGTGAVDLTATAGPG